MNYLSFRGIIIKKIMKYTKIDLFGTQKSRGTYDDFFDTEKYSSMREAYDANDYVECDFVQGADELLYIEAKHTNAPDVKEYHRLNVQNPFAGLDVLDDEAGVALAMSLLVFTQNRI